MTYGFLGAGNMASAIIRGMTRAGVPGADILVYDVSAAALDKLAADCGTVSQLDMPALAEKADVLVLAVKPQVLTPLFPALKAALGQKQSLIISIAAARPLADLEAGLGQRPIVRVMPNINAKAGAATSAFCTNERVTEAHRNTVKEIFGAVGSIDELAESLFPVFSALAGSSPAFAYLYIDALARAAVRYGLPKQLALKFSAQTALGSAKLVLESGEHPYALADQVCSPAGTTIEGVCALQQNGFEAALAQALAAVVEKDRKLQG